MPKFAALDRALDDDLVLPVPIPGQDEPKEYRIPPMSAKAGLFAQRMMNLALAASIEADQRRRDPDRPASPAPRAPVLDDDEERDLYELILGKPLLAEMLEDEVTWPWVQRVAQTALLYATADADAAQAYWINGGPGKALGRKASRATARSQKKAGPSGTRASQKARTKAKAPRGSGSSSGGR